MEGILEGGRGGGSEEPVGFEGGRGGADRLGIGTEGGLLEGTVEAVDFRVGILCRMDNRSKYNTSMQVLLLFFFISFVIRETREVE